MAEIMRMVNVATTTRCVNRLQSELIAHREGHG